MALELARRVGGEIVSVDSMQVYRGLDVGTAKPSAAERAAVPHHLIDVADLDENFDAARFAALAAVAVAQIQARTLVPLFCGGTGLYFNVFLGGLGTAPASNAALRTELEATPLPALLAELARLDPATFDQIDQENRRRVVRAVEVIRLTGHPFSQQRAPWSDQAAPFQGRAIGLQRSRDDLIRRINQRVDSMFAAGLIDETRRLLARGLESNRTPMQAIGYRQVVEHLRGERGRLETIELVKVRTRQFAKRQLTWFRGQLNLTWIDVAERESPGETAKKIQAALSAVG